MPFKPKIKIQLIKCKTCGKTYNNPLSHVCKIRMDKPPHKAVKRRVAAKKTTTKKKRRR